MRPRAVLAVNVAVTAIISSAAMFMCRVLRLRRAALEHSRQIEEALQRLRVAQERLQRDDQRLDRFEQRLETVQRCMIEQLAAQAAVPTSIHRVSIPDSHNWLAEASPSSVPVPVPAPMPAPGRLQLALCGTQWTVLHMAPGGTGTGEPTALCQHQARDFMMCACAASGLVFSGDKEAQLRVWCARTGELLARVGFSGAAVTAMAASAGRLLVGDSQGHVTALSSSALLRGETHAIAWRAHDGKTATLHARPYDDGFLSGGTDGAVRSWQYAELQREAHELRLRAVSARSAVGSGSLAGGSGRLRSSACVELGLFAIANPAAMVCVARHQDTVTALCRDGELAVSGSREGEVQVNRLADGSRVFRLPSLLGPINCLACLRGKLLLCSDDGHQATLQLWDLTTQRLVQELGGIRKWNAPTHIAYIGCDRAIWVRDTTLSVLTWVEAP